MSRDQHEQAVLLALQEVQELQTMISMARGKADSVVGAIVQAVGERGNVKSARNALENAAVVRDRLDELAGPVHVVDQELLRYLGGF